MTQRDWLLSEMGDTAEELAWLISFVEKNLPGATKSDVSAFSYLLDGIVDLARAQGELLPALKEYGIYTVEQAIRENIKRLEAEAAARGDTTIEEEVKEA